MYRADRFNNDSSGSKFPIIFAVSTVVVLAVGIACSTEDDRPKKVVATTPSPTQPTTAFDSGSVVPPSFVGEPVTFASAQAAYTKRDYRGAAESFGRYVQQHPKNAFGHYMLGLSTWKSGDLNGARDALERALTLDSTNVKTLLNLGRVLLEQGKTDDAFVRIEAAVALDSGSAEVHRMMGRVQSARGQRDSAMLSYRMALSIDPADSWSMNNLGLLLIEQGRYEEALPALARAVELRPESPAFANNLGVALERTGHMSEAAQAFKAALTADSTYAKAARSLARVEGRVGESYPVDVSAMAAAFNEELQNARKERLMAKAVVKPDSVR
jgi:Tfp pilus assembly protein PilF